MSAFRRFDPWADLVEEPGGAAKVAKPAKVTAAPAGLLASSTAGPRRPASNFSDFSSFSGPEPPEVEKPRRAGATAVAHDSGTEAHERRPWGQEDGRRFFEGRAAIAGHDGGADRTTAERWAFEACVARWLTANPPAPQPDPSRCLVCGEPEAAGRPLLPILAGDDGHRWLHDACLEPHWRRRLADAAAVLCGPV